MGKFFRYDFGLGAAIIYSAVVLLANLDKDWETMWWLVARQAIVTFFTASTIVAYVIAVAQSEKKSKFQAYVLGILAPAAVVASASFVAHWYFTNEYRNVLTPFVVSLALNTIAAAGVRAGHTTLLAQITYVFEQVFKLSAQIKRGIKYIAEQICKRS